LLDLRGATVTIDALGCQRSIARDIVRRDGDYLLAVKKNQATLYDDIERAFEDALDTSERAQDMPAPLVVESSESVDKGHGRIETRKTYICRDLSWLSTAKRWEGISAIAMSEATRQSVSSDNIERHRRYYIASRSAVTASEIAHLIRRHWGIENEVHWVLDVAFREDEARHRAGNCAANMGVLRKMAVNLLKADTTKKVGIANKRKAASWDRNYLLRVMTGPS
jgi:predicted transposase YbfD/YdcC